MRTQGSGFKVNFFKADTLSGGGGGQRAEFPMRLLRLTERGGGQKAKFERGY